MHKPRAMHLQRYSLGVYVMRGHTLQLSFWDVLFSSSKPSSVPTPAIAIAVSSSVLEGLGEKEFHIDASRCMDERRHQRFVARRMKKMAASAFSAVCVIFLCGFGSFITASIISRFLSFIRISSRIFSFVLSVSV